MAASVFDSVRPRHSPTQAPSQAETAARPERAGLWLRRLAPVAPGSSFRGIGTIINSGTITGGLSGDGLARANAISFSNSGNVLELRAGSNITGTVAGSGSDTLRLGGSANSGFD